MRRLKIIITVILAVILVWGISTYNGLVKKQEEEAPAPAPEPSAEEKLLTEIRDLLKTK